MISSDLGIVIKLSTKSDFRFYHFLDSQRNKAYFLGIKSYYNVLSMLDSELIIERDYYREDKPFKLYKIYYYEKEKTKEN